MKKNIKAVSAIAALCAAMGIGIVAFLSNREDAPAEVITTEPQTEATTAEPTTEEYKDILPANWAEMYSYSASDMGMTQKAREWKRRNKDYIGWLRFDGTYVDYPVMLDPGEIEEGDPVYGPEARVPNSFYLDHSWDMSYFRDGAIYMDCKDNFSGADCEQSENLVIYGHNMANGTMFGSVRRYRQDPEYFYDNAFIELSNCYKDYKYVIFAFLITPGSYNATDFIYWNMENMDSKEDFDFYIDNCKAKWLLDTGVDVEYGDQLLTLSTCYADYDNSRFIVVGRRLREGEVYGDLSTIQCREDYKKEHPDGIGKPKPVTEEDGDNDEASE